MKILYWTPQFWPNIGGIEVLACRTLPALQRCGHEFLVVTSHDACDSPDLTHFRDIPVHRFPLWKALASRDLLRVRKLQEQIAALKRSFAPDLVHLHFPGHIAYFHLRTLDAHYSPTLLTVHTPFEQARGGTDTILGQVLRSADWITAVSHATLADTISLEPEIRERSSVIYNGVAAPELEPSTLPFEEPRVLYVGRLEVEKGVDIAIAAFARVSKKIPRARLTISGDGPVRAELEKQAAQAGLSSAIDFIGWTPPDKVPELMNTATVVVVPSRYREPFALVAVEAALSGRPVVATRTGGLQETVADGQTGLLFDKENTGELAEAICRLLKNPPAARAMGETGRRRALELFGLEKFISAYDGLYRSLVQNSAPLPAYSGSAVTQALR